MTSKGCEIPSAELLKALRARSREAARSRRASPLRTIRESIQRAAAAAGRWLALVQGR